MKIGSSVGCTVGTWPRKIRPVDPSTVSPFTLRDDSAVYCELLLTVIDVERVRAR
jgi:hypothetical protein